MRCAASVPQLGRQLDALINDPSLGGPPAMFPQFLEVRPAGRASWWGWAGCVARPGLPLPLPPFARRAWRCVCRLAAAVAGGAAAADPSAATAAAAVAAAGVAGAAGLAARHACCPLPALHPYHPQTHHSTPHHPRQVWSAISLNPELPAQERSAVPFVAVLQVGPGGWGRPGLGLTRVLAVEGEAA